MIEGQKILILTEGGDKIGFGHYTRCSSLKEFAISKKLICKILLFSKGTYNFEGVEVHNWLEDKEYVFNHKNEYSYLLIDSYLAPLNYYFEVFKLFGTVIVIDDYNRLPFKAHYILNPNIFGDTLSYPEGVKVLAGKDYVIIRAPFRNTPRKKLIGNKIDNVLITLGGSDYRGLLPLLIASISELHLSITVVAGNERYRKELDQDYHSECREIIGFADAETMVQKMLEADIVVSACGQTLHELGYLGCPTIAICIDVDQIPNQKRYIEIGFLQKDLSWNDPSLKNKIQELVKEMSYDVRQKLSDIGKSFIDGRGVENIYHKIFEEC
jgi:UDP-2,4-diacetamido-2,4,6-trideoxy-beta-L-altropyranose hydrolase